MLVAADLYPDIENPRGPVIMQKKATHSAQQFKMSEDCLVVWNDKVDAARFILGMDVRLC